ncbi:hypothetical protein BRC68_12420 [Halobacteriales archaeon QH_6_64_20]|nr:MAG: hypothetical protein BRC68_12420 [Halobacteriales archaeon QH_6_64_20]
MTSSVSGSGGSSDRCRRCGATGVVETDGDERSVDLRLDSGPEGAASEPRTELCPRCLLRTAIRAFLR